MECKKSCQNLVRSPVMESMLRELCEWEVVVRSWGLYLWSAVYELVVTF